MVGPQVVYDNYLFHNEATIESVECLKLPTFNISIHSPIFERVVRYQNPSHFNCNISSLFSFNYKFLAYVQANKANKYVFFKNEPYISLF